MMKRTVHMVQLDETDLVFILSNLSQYNTSQRRSTKISFSLMQIADKYSKITTVEGASGFVCLHKTEEERTTANGVKRADKPKVRSILETWVFDWYLCERLRDISMPDPSSTI